ncbi:MAG: terminase small subunit [Candidatus Omnitrophica bacterium]|nr:terminase small subunit [Candidatus Omnitrophota bacterium]
MDLVKSGADRDAIAQSLKTRYKGRWLGKHLEDPILEAFCQEYVFGEHPGRAGASMQAVLNCSRANGITKAIGVTSHPLVASRIRQLRDIKREVVIRENIADEAEILEVLTKLVRSDITHYAEWGSSLQETVRDLVDQAVQDVQAGESEETVNKHISAFVKKIKSHAVLRDSSEIDGTLVRSVRMTREGPQIELFDKLKAIELLGKALSIFRDSPGSEENRIPLNSEQAIALEDQLAQEIKYLERHLAAPAEIVPEPADSTSPAET